MVTIIAAVAITRLSAADAALMPDDAVLPPWFSYSGTEYVEPNRDPWFHQSLVVDASMFGAVPDDGADDTAAIQAAYDYVCRYVKWDMSPRMPEDRHGFIILDPGVYWVSQIHPCAGSTLYGYGATLQRPPWAWWVDRHGGDEAAALAEVGSSKARIINGWGYHPRIEYAWMHDFISPPMRFVGVTLDGNASKGGFADWHAYQLWDAHLAVFMAMGPSSNRAAVKDLRVEMIDITATDSPADCVAVVQNVSLYLRRYQTDGCFRGALNSLGNNNSIDAQYLYLTGPPGDMRGFDREPQGSSQGYDKHTGEDWTNEQKSVREYWHVRDAVLASAGFDLASSALHPDANTAVGGELLFERIYILRPNTLNVIQYGGNRDGSPVLTVLDSWIRGGSIVGFGLGDGGAFWGLGKVRWSQRVRFERVRFVLAKPGEDVLASFFATAPASKQTLFPVMLWLDQTSLGTTVPDTLLELIDCDFDLDVGWESSAYKSKLQAIAVRQDGDAGSGHRLRWIGGRVGPGFRWGLYQFHGGDALLDDADIGSARLCSYVPKNWSSSVVARGASTLTSFTQCQGSIISLDVQ